MKSRPNILQALDSIRTVPSPPSLLAVAVGKLPRLVLVMGCRCLWVGVGCLKQQEKASIYSAVQGPSRRDHIGARIASQLDLRFSFGYDSDIVDRGLWLVGRVAIHVEVASRSL
ncbi:hypothetical protein L2E82_04709 [Cichorium intybus]|uniref:Uncharacterized protein n=1 Tax=Cichorium intybus TaxID=13427 RepID=A0ACB9H5Y2_CICIN|nr:hypothetical protein L2E82_04709 [Cichorium intybus]